MKKNGLIITIFLLNSASLVFAGGTTASFLKLGSGARAAGLGGAFAAVSDDINALSYNPAGLSNLKNSEIGFTRAQLVEGVSYNFFGYSRSVAKGVMGLGINYLSQSSIEGRSANREVTGSFEASDMAVNLAYGLPLNMRSSTSALALNT